jgi:hypothetical protein
MPAPAQRWNRRGARYVVAVFALSVGIGVRAGCQSVPKPGPLERERIVIENRKVSLDSARFAFEQQKYERDHELEERKAMYTALGLLLPLYGALVAYVIQVRARKKDETLQFQLKAAEIVMDARDTNQVKRKAELLTKLFPGRLRELEGALKQNDYPYFGRSNETREELLKLLAQYPEGRSEILRAWALLFPWDSADSGWSKKSDADKGLYKWLDELARDAVLSQNKVMSARPSNP